MIPKFTTLRTFTRPDATAARINNIISASQTTAEPHTDPPAQSSKFKTLPKELWWLIWKLFLPDPRTVKAYVCRKKVIKPGTPKPYEISEDYKHLYTPQYITYWSLSKNATKHELSSLLSARLFSSWFENLNRGGDKVQENS